MIEKANLTRNGGRVRSRAFHARDGAIGSTENGEQLPSSCRIDLQLRFGGHHWSLQQRIRLLVTARNIKVLTKPVRTLSIHEFPLQLLVVDAAYRSARWIQF